MMIPSTAKTQRIKEVQKHWNALQTLFGRSELSFQQMNDYSEALKFIYEKRLTDNLSPLTTMLLRLEGKPYSLLPDHFPMSPMFNIKVPPSVIWQTGRQVSKSTTAAARTCMRALMLPYHSILTVTPRIEQIRRFSNNYIKPFINQSPCKELFSEARVEQNVLQRTLPNGSILFFSFAFMSCDRIRGIAAKELNVDECQDLDFDFLPVIRETMSASPHGVLETFTGTPKSTSHATEKLFQKSSQAEWVMPCGCGHHNIPNSQNGVMEMIRPEGLSCRKCSRPLNPRVGNWVHAYPDRSAVFAGYHLPQVIMPSHWANPVKWAALYRSSLTPDATFFNEKLGEACDVGVRDLTPNHLRAAATLPWKNRMEEGVAQSHNYVMRVLGVDWGGQGEKEVSYTAGSVLGLTATGRVDCLYGERLPLNMTPVEETRRLRHIFHAFNCYGLAHDYGGVGALREVFLIQAGIPADRIMPILYTTSSSIDLITYKTPENVHRSYYSTDRSRALGVTMAAIQIQALMFPQYDSCEQLLSDWLALYKERVETLRRSEFVIYRRQGGMSDDFAHACTFGCLFLWHANDSWPDFSRGYRLDDGALQEEEPSDPRALLSA